jgi:murein DD-endopeptidase MepM/ murein hydrolase activator NlpD
VQIILLHRRAAAARTLTFSDRRVVMAAVALAFAFVVVAIGAAALFVRYAGHAHSPWIRQLVDPGQHDAAADRDRRVRDDINAMAVKLGEMQAQMMRLDALGGRVSGLAGIDPQAFDFRSVPARGGVTPTDARRLSLDELARELDRTALDVERRREYLDAVETELVDATLRSKMMPTIQPVDVSYNASGFGSRLDPFTGAVAIHQGIDFVAPAGTPIVAAAGGVVVAAEWHHDFGNMVEIDHGNDIRTLYAHASKLYVRTGDVVKRDQHIADIGATGRATGAHLHFEVHVRDVPQNPQKFLDAGAHDATAAAATR